MDNFNWLLQGFAEAATPMNLLYAVIGVLLGTAVGVLPGIGPAMTVALLLPITYNVPPSAVNVQWLDLALLLVFGLLGLMMRRFGLPVLPLIIGVILGPRIERQLRQSLQLGAGDWTSLFTEPVAIIVYILIGALLVAPLILRLFHRPEPDLVHASALEEHAEEKREEKAGA